VITNLWNSPHNPFSSSKSSPSGRNKNRPETIDDIINTFQDEVQKNSERNHLLIEALEDIARFKATPDATSGHILTKIETLEGMAQFKTNEK